MATGLEQGRPNCILCARCTFHVKNAQKIAPLPSLPFLLLLVYASPNTCTPAPFEVGWFDPVWGRKLCPPECPAELVGRGDESAIAKVNSLWLLTFGCHFRLGP